MSFVFCSLLSALLIFFFFFLPSDFVLDKKGSYQLFWCILGTKETSLVEFGNKRKHIISIDGWLTGFPQHIENNEEK